ncbi:tetratricopeptide repeat protein [Aeromonas media]|uniref:Tetratricopeptide repeat protein n=1 Tax=Aeromonas media TaxID=651 RepID=A0A6M4YJ77_AERME|nr:tetratricopeptide repeat protein [Aeromonas media]MBS4639178.1 tetratricopeptide repeat protein [Aeromonas media]QJT24805.1 tetratricopeptide repeat protein [Aeromonas media]QJT31520.1 tetratricopeptide repeat protein [Aeromonas media]QJT33978.1 tetratricopeptide repeat protein [Aeromonas media]QJT39556.1 tetratricopeptide repeat protein [Aeromonas media]
MIVDINPQNFHAELIDASMKKPVVIYFHAPQMPECQGMTPLVETLVGPANPAVTLAKVDMNDPQLQPLASQLGLRALPALVLFHQGRPDEQAILEGPQDEATLRQYFAAFAPKEEELLLEKAQQALADCQADVAYAHLTQAHRLAPERHDISLWLVQAALDLALLDEAQALLAAVPMVAQDDHYQTLSSRLALALQASDSPELRALEQRHAETPDDGALTQELAVLYSQVGRQEEALALLFNILKRDMAFGDAKKIYLDILTTMGAHPAAQSYRRKLYSLLY